MKYIGFFFSLLFSLLLAVGLSINLGNLPPLAKIFDPFKGFWQNAYSEDYDPETEVNIAGLQAEVEVTYDENLIPHIFAENEKDLYLVQGFTTARHRLWQMEFQVLAAEGRLSEIVGEVALNRDREMRRKGLGFGAKNKLKYLKNNDPETLQLMEAYAEGVNAYIAQLSQAELPLEYKLLDYYPEPWSPYKTLLFLMNMAETLSGDSDLANTNFRNLFGSDWQNRLFPDYPQDVLPVVAKDDWDFIPIEVEEPDSTYIDSIKISQLLPEKEPGLGSNNWVVSGEKTASGFPILANDPHLALNLPSLWFAAQLSTPKYTVKGATLPGTLGVIIGFNENLAWGMTNADRDVKDWYKITFKDSSREEYLYNGQWIQSRRQLEIFSVKGQNDFVDTVIYTHYGPIVYDRNFKMKGKPVNFALKWTAHGDSNEQKTFIHLNKAKGYPDFEEALSHYAAPAQNFVFASRNGDIGIKVQGKFPLKWRGQGKYLMDGSKPIYEWQGYIPGEHNAEEINPEKHFVTSANQHPVSDNYPYFVYNNNFEYFRNRRISDQLLQQTSITIDDMKALQLDNYNLHASEILPLMLDSLNGENKVLGEKWLARLEAWDYDADADEMAPALFQSWWDQIERGLFATWEAKGLPISYPNKFNLANSMKNEPNADWFDDPQTNKVEGATFWINKGFSGMVGEMEGLTAETDSISWSSYKNTHISHLIPNLTPFGRFNIPIGGGKGIVNASAADWGPGWRMIVEMGSEIKAVGVYPGGQSGNPGSKYYDNLVDAWASGEYLTIGLRDRNKTSGDLFYTKFSAD
ncbi:penicillin acylase family protein [Cyclobacterium marinum]|uniref:penicillin acylase family protein n=1 Tax=Cyclobacterium marinum TaxID=104 RepID=UPI0011EFDF3C|nr:penicillin acylase family protein [Cyclobacterium marinum]MBI0400383.1 penicillin acylase family protein [Cyclobacterium marinum]